MPIAPPKPCSHHGCGALVRDGSGYCAAHLQAKHQAVKIERQQAEKDRGTSTQRGYGYKWQKLRASYLASHPMCVECRKIEEQLVAVCVCMLNESKP